MLLFLAFALYFCFQDVPARATVLVSFGEFLLRSFTCAKSALNTIAAVRRFHYIHGYSEVAFEAPGVALWKRALPLTLRGSPSAAPPFPLPLLQRACALAASLGPKGQVFAALLAVAFHSMARLSSLLPATLNSFVPTRHPTLADFHAQGEAVSLFLKWAKNCQDVSQGFAVPLFPSGGSPACPVARLTDLRALLRGLPPTAPLFSFPLGGKRGTSAQGGFTISLARGWLSCLLRTLGRGEEGLTFHSLRRGACTLAFQRGASVSDLQALGGWRSDAVKVYFSQVHARERAARFLVG